MGYAVYKVGHRWGGYGVPAICEYLKCNKEIDRGMSYACGGEPFSEIGCDRYFCREHLLIENWNEEKGEWCKHKEDCECKFVEVCERCASGKEPFPYKSEHPKWVKHLLTDKTWREWRNKNKDEVKKLKLTQAGFKIK